MLSVGAASCHVKLRSESLAAARLVGGRLAGGPLLEKFGIAFRLQPSFSSKQHYQVLCEDMALKVLVWLLQSIYK